MDKEVFSKLPKDLLQSAYYDLADQRLKSKYIQTLLEAANALFQQPTPYNSLRDKNLRGYFERPQVKEFLKRSGFVADGCYVVTREEEKLADKARHLLAEREAILSKLQQKERDRLERLCRLTTPLKNVTCTDSFMDRQLQSIQETKRKLLNLRAQGQPAQPATKHSVDHKVGVQTRSKSKSTKQTTAKSSKKKTPTKSVAPSVDTESHDAQTQPSSVGPGLHLPPIATKNCGTQVTPNPSMIEVRANMLHAIADENERLKQLYHDQMLKQEEESLKIRLQYDKKRQERSNRHIQDLKVMQVQRGMDRKKTLKQEKMELHHRIKRRIALETIVSALQEEKHKATMAAAIQLEKQRALEDERKRQAALLEAKQKTAKRKKEKFSEYRDELFMSPGTSPSLPKPPASPTLFSQAATESGVGVQLGHAVPSHEKSIASAQVSDVITLPGQVLVANESEEVVDHGRGTEGGGITSGEQQLTADKETNTSMSLLHSIAHLIPTASQPAECSIVAESLQKSATSVQLEQSHVNSTASQTGLSMADIAAFTEELENEEERLIAKESQEVDERDYLEAVGEVQAAISQELLESAIQMAPQISEAVVKRVSSMGPEAMQVLEEIKSRASVCSQLGSGLQSRKASTTSVERGRTPTPYPSAGSVSITQIKSNTSSIASSGKVVPSHQSISPSLESINEGMMLTNELACALEPPQEDVYEESAEMCHGTPPRYDSFSTAGSSTNPRGLSWISTCVAKDTAKALIDQIFCEVVQHPMSRDMLSGTNQETQILDEATEERDASATGEFKCLDRKSISVPAPPNNQQYNSIPGASSVTLKTTVSEMPFHTSGSSSRTFVQHAIGSKPLSALKDSISAASTKRRSPSPSTSKATTQADNKANTSSVQSTRSVKDRLSAQGSVSADNSPSVSRPASKASVVSQKVSSRGATSRLTISQASSAASKLYVGDSHKSLQGVRSQQGGPVSVKTSEVAMAVSTKTTQIGNPVSSPSLVITSRMEFSKPSSTSAIGSGSPEGVSTKSACSMVSRQDSTPPAPDSQQDSHLSKSSMQASSVKMVESSKRSSASPSPGEPVSGVSCDHLSKTSTCKSTPVGMELVLYVNAEAPPTDAEALKYTDLGCESVTVSDSADVEEDNHLVVTTETNEEELKDAGTPKGDSEKDTSMNSMASSGSLPQDVFVREAAAEVMERAPSRHADSAASSGQSASLPPLSLNAEDIDQPEAMSALDNTVEEEGAVVASEDGKVLPVQGEEVQPPEDGDVEVFKHESAVAAGGSEEQSGGTYKSTTSLSKDGEAATSIQSISNNLAGEGICKPPSESSLPAAEETVSGVVASQQTEPATDHCGEEDISVVHSESTSIEEIATKAICQSEEGPMLQESSTLSAKQSNTLSTGMESNAPAPSVGKPSSSTASVNVGSKVSAVSICKPSSKQPSTASVVVESNVSAASVGKSSSKQPSTASVNVGPKASAACVDKPSSKQPSTASVSVGSKTSVASIGKPSFKQPSTASVVVEYNVSAASVGKPSSKKPSTASVNVGSKMSAASVGKPSSKQPSTVSVGMESNVSATSVGKRSSRQPSTASVSVGSKVSAASVGKPFSKQASTASVSVGSKTSTANVGKPSTKQLSTASVCVSRSALAGSIGKPLSKQLSTASVSVAPSASAASVGKPSSKQPSTASVSVGSKVSVASLRRLSSKQPGVAGVEIDKAAGESPTDVPQPVESMGSTEQSVTGNDEVTSDEVAKAQPTGESDIQSAGCNEVALEKPPAMPVEENSLSCEGAPGGDEDDAVMTPVSQLTSEVEAEENAIITETAQDQASSLFVKATDVSLDEDSVRPEGSETPTAKESSCSPVKRGESISTEVEAEDAAASNSNDVASPAVVDDSNDKMLTPSETVSDGVSPTEGVEAQVTQGEPPSAEVEAENAASSNSNGVSNVELPAVVDDSKDEMLALPSEPVSDSVPPTEGVEAQVAPS